MRVESNASAARLLAAQLRTVLEDFGQGWGTQLRLAATARRPYPTLRPRKGSAPRQCTNAELAVILQNNGRDLFRVTSQMRSAIVRQLQERFAQRAIPSSSQIMMAVGPLYKAWVLERALHNGADTPMPANTARWTAYKARLGLSTNRVKASGQLAAAIKSAPTQLVRLR